MRSAERNNVIKYEMGGLAVSLAGHDKDDIFIILREDGEYVYLVDGNLRRLDKPKRKNKKHIQIILRKDEDLSRKLIDGTCVTDEEIRRFIKCYKRENQV